MITWSLLSSSIVQDNSLVTITPLAPFRNLRTLDISNNKLVTLEGQGMISLRSYWMSIDVDIRDLR